MGPQVAAWLALCAGLLANSWTSALRAESSAQPLTIVAHRGSMTHAPENTLAALHWAKRIGADAAEIDLRTTQDGSFVLMHDLTLTRTTNCKGRISRRTLQEVQACHTADNNPVPLATDAFALASQLELPLVLDLKGLATRRLPQLVTLLRDQKLQHQVVLGARSLAHVRKLHSIDNTMNVLAFTAMPDQALHWVASGADAVRVWPHTTRANLQQIRTLTQAGTSVWVTAGMRSIAELKPLIDAGVSTVIADRPNEILD